jgi:UDPglucose 6-dehydrogenase/GDP-mannose 6-dehydrogenase
MLATQISFANEIANLCAAIGDIDVAQVMEGVHLSHYLQPFVTGTPKRMRAPLASFLEAGCGFGGSCLPKDVKALIAHGRKAGASMRVLESVLETNVHQPGRLVALLNEHFPDLAGVRVSVLGLAFWRHRRARSRHDPGDPTPGARRRGARIRSVARETTRAARRARRELLTTEDAVADADAVMLVTRWKSSRRFRGCSEDRSAAVVVDGRRVLDQAIPAPRIGLRTRAPAGTAGAVR